MNRQEKEAVIMAEMADKTLSFWCLLEDEDWLIAKYVRERFDFSTTLLLKKRLITYDEDLTPLGHPIYPHHILQRLDNNNIYWLFSTKRLTVSYRWDKYIPRDLEKDLYWQSDETIDKLYSLIQQVKWTNN